MSRSVGHASNTFGSVILLVRFFEEFELAPILSVSHLLVQYTNNSG